jgi:hypothetical protein
MNGPGGVLPVSASASMPFPGSLGMLPPLSCSICHRRGGRAADRSWTYEGELTCHRRHGSQPGAAARQLPGGVTICALWTARFLRARFSPTATESTI